MALSVITPAPAPTLTPPTPTPPQHVLPDYFPATPPTYDGSGATASQNPYDYMPKVPRPRRILTDMTKGASPLPGEDARQQYSTTPIPNRLYLDISNHEQCREPESCCWCRRTPNDHYVPLYLAPITHTLRKSYYGDDRRQNHWQDGKDGGRIPPEIFGPMLGLALSQPVERRKSYGDDRRQKFWQDGKDGERIPPVVALSQPVERRNSGVARCA